MSISLKSQKMLWGRAAGRCSNPSCRVELYEDRTVTDDPTLVGENCHIISESDDGPRADPKMPLNERNHYANLILLCRNCHRIVDTQEGQYNVERLHQMKREHESWVRIKLHFDEVLQRKEEQYAHIIDEWERLAHVYEWRIWSSSVLSFGQPSLRADVDSDLFQLRRWLISRIWPETYPKLIQAFHNFRLVLGDFQNQFREHAEPRNEGKLWTRKFYHINSWDKEMYDKLLQDYNLHVSLVQDLMLELTRSANHICECVRQLLSPTYRIEEGHLTVVSGPFGDLMWHETVPQYSEQELEKEYPYPGLEEFLTERQHRDYCFGGAK